MAPDDSVMGQSAAGGLQWVSGLLASPSTLGVEARHSVHAFVPSMPGMVIAARLGPGNVHERTRRSASNLEVIH